MVSCYEIAAVLLCWSSIHSTGSATLSVQQKYHRGVAGRAMAPPCNHSLLKASGHGIQLALSSGSHMRMEGEGEEREPGTH